VWSVAVEGTPTALPVVVCGAVTKVLAVAAVSVTVPETQQPGTAAVLVGLSGLPRYPAVNVTLNVWGPYSDGSARAAAGCSGSTTIPPVVQKMNGDATLPFSPYLDPGWYALQAAVPSGELHQGSQSRCLAAGTMVHVTLP
jgi:hypothetical protein